MTDPPQLALNSLCAVRVFDNNGKLLVRGSGAFVGEGRHILTARHVAIAGVEANTCCSVYVSAMRSWCKASVQRELLPDTEIDAALLELDTGVEAQPPLPICQPPVNLYLPDEVACTGFPGWYYDGDRPRDYDVPGLRLDGRHPGGVAGRELLRLRISAGSTQSGQTGDIEEALTNEASGLSGAPVFRRDTSQAFGIIAARPKRGLRIEGSTLVALGFHTLLEHASGLYDRLGSQPRPADVHKIDPDRASRLRQDICTVTAGRVKELLPDRQTKFWREGTRKGDGFTQQQAWTRIQDLLNPAIDGRVRCVFGPRGIGKTTLALRLAEKAAKRYKNALPAPLPLLILTVFITFTQKQKERVADNPTPEILWTTLTDAWLSYANRVMQSRLPGAANDTVSREQLRAALICTPVLIIIDGLDDLCMRLGVTPYHADAMLAWVMEQSRSHGRAPLGVLVTLREDLDLPRPPLPSRLGHGLIRLGLMNNDAVARLVGRRIYKRIALRLDTEAETMLRRPFLLSLLRDRQDVGMERLRLADILRDAALLGLGQIAEKDLELLLRQSCLIGYAAYRRFHRERGGDRSFTATAISEMLRLLADENMELMSDRAFAELAGDPVTIAAITDAPEQYMFMQSPDGQSTFTHPIWSDFAVAHFLANAIFDRRLLALGATTFSGEIFSLTGELLLPSVKTVISEALTSALYTAAHLPEGRREANDPAEFALGNLVIIARYAHISFTDNNLDAIKTYYAELPALVRHVLMSELSARLLRSPQPQDRLLECTIVSLCDITLSHVEWPWATRSLAWLLLAANGRTPAEPWPSFIPARDVAGTLRLACGADGPGQQERRSTLQDGYVRAMAAVTAAPYRLFGALHYFLFAVIVCADGTMWTQRYSERLKAFIGGDQRSSPSKLKLHFRNALLAEASNLGTHLQVEDLITLTERLYCGEITSVSPAWQ